MPWLSIFMALLAWLSADKSTPAARTNALMGAALAGGATYAVTHGTDWGKANLGQFDGVVDPDALIPTTTKTVNGVTYDVPNGQVLQYDSDGSVILDGNGSPIFATDTTVVPTVENGLLSTTGEILKSWGGTGTAAVIGTTALATGAAGSVKDLLPWILGGFALFLLVK